MKRPDMATMKAAALDGCVYCGSLDTDHKHGPGRSCGHCCATHGGLTATDPDTYDWVKELVEGRRQLVNSTLALLDYVSDLEERVRQAETRAFNEAIEAALETILDEEDPMLQECVAAIRVGILELRRQSESFSETSPEEAKS